jgi:hypothetical protein
MYGVPIEEPDGRPMTAYPPGEKEQRQFPKRNNEHIHVQDCTVVSVTDKPRGSMLGELKKGKLTKSREESM